VEELQVWYAEGFVGIDNMQEAMRMEGQKALAKGEALARESGVCVEAALLEAKGERIATVIIEDAKRWPADVIVMGTHGRSGFNHLIFGSVAEGVVRTATVPILLIRAE
jgi:nucleotide-binding universal stress UspA family protein